MKIKIGAREIEETPVERQIIILERRIAYWEYVISEKKISSRERALTHIALSMLREQVREDRERIAKNVLT